MSDPEDLQSDRKSSVDEWTYQLKRIGPPATCPKVPDVMKLNLGLTKIGRGQQNDFYLDSAVLKNFISRSHVEIFGKKNENGEVEYMLTDKGLNGTFINDIRTHKTCVMEIGDKVTFGHTNGYKIQPGSYAEQPTSEFQFMFERVPKVRKTSEIISEGLTAVATPDEESRVESTDLKKESTVVSDRLFLGDLQSNVQSQEKCTKSRTSQKGRNRKDSSEHSDLELPSSKNSSHSKNNHVTKKGNSDSANKSLHVETSSSRRKVSTGSARDRFSETLVAQEEEEEEDDDDDDDDDDDNDNNDEEDNDSEEEEEVEEEEVKPKVDMRRKKVQRKVSQPKKAPAKRKVTVPSDSDDSSEEDEASKPEADQKPKAPSQSNLRQKQTKKKKSGNDAPAVGSRKRRRRGAATGQSTATTSDDLEPGVEWYEDDRCEAPDCKRPKKKRTPWVQCDDCDSWYHTVCVGANYNRLKDSDEHFNCGCE